MEDLDGKITGDTLSAPEWNQVPAEIQNVITQLGQILTSGDLNQLGKGIAGYVANGTFYTDSGIANSYVLSGVGAKQTPSSYSNGFSVRFFVGNSNTGASTVNVAGIGAKSIKNDGGAALAADALVSGQFVELVYNGVDFLLSPQLRDIKSKGIIPYRSDTDYSVNSVVMGSDSTSYRCLIANGPTTSVVNPVGDLTQTWDEFVLPSGILNGVSAARIKRGLQTRVGPFIDQLDTQVWSDGFKYSYLGRQPYDIIDFTKAGVSGVDYIEYYIDYASGSDAATGLVGDPWKTINHAITTIVTDAVVHVADDMTGFLSNTVSIRATTVNLKFIGEGPKGKTTWLSLREDVTKASFSWVDEGTGAWTTASPLRTFKAMFDRAYLDDRGLPTPISVATSKANCIATPGTFFETGTSELTVHLHGGREPDPISEGGDWMPASTEQRIEFQSDTATVLFENIDFVNNQGINNGGLRFRSVTSATPSTANLGARNCNSYGSSGEGFQVYDAKVYALEECWSQYTRGDGINSHSFVVTGGLGDYISGYETDCGARQCGYDGWDGQIALSDSTNGFTSHDNISVERINPQADYTWGAVFADVLGAVTENWLAQASQPNHGIGDPAPRACFWAKDLGTVMVLHGCYGDDQDGLTTLLTTTNDAIIKVDQWLGDKSGTISGDIQKFNGDPVWGN